MTARVSPAERVRVEMAELIAETTTSSLTDKFEEVARLALQFARKAEISESWAGTATPGRAGPRGLQPARRSSKLGD